MAPGGQATPPRAGDGPESRAQTLQAGVVGEEEELRAPALAEAVRIRREELEADAGRRHPDRPVGNAEDPEAAPLRLRPDHDLRASAGEGLPFAEQEEPAGSRSTARLEALVGQEVAWRGRTSIGVVEREVAIPSARP